MRWYGGAAAELTKEGATERVLEVVKKFHKVNPEKVRTALALHSSVDHFCVKALFVKALSSRIECVYSWGK